MRAPGGGETRWGRPSGAARTVSCAAPAGPFGPPRGVGQDALQEERSRRSRGLEPCEGPWCCGPSTAGRDGLAAEQGPQMVPLGGVLAPWHAENISTGSPVVMVARAVATQLDSDVATEGDWLPLEG
ncbi:hypothetical protein NDU88_000929 [Pleurodeles waltl]|uniref:Uncharacterized protein n=1 Tax=Pleurodeles waltl TaxID=8319 RepID=A0AAV7TGD5_PLEWA|nr:hypothetical protein NDU88_000929 [Pleurodeles waltl]